MAKEPKKKVITKKDQSRVRREQRQKRWIVLGTSAVLILVLGVVAFGLLYELVFQGMQAVAVVNDEKITLNEYQTEVRYQRFQSLQTYLNYYQIYDALGAEMGSSFLSGLQNIQFQLSEQNALQFGQDILQQMVDNELIAQYAEENGISLAQDEIEEALQSAFRYYPEGTPTPEPSVTPFTTSTLTDLQIALVSPTPEFSLETVQPGEETPTEEAAVPQATNTPAQTETEAESEEEPTATLVPTITPTSEPTPTATPYTFESYQQDLDDFIDRLEEVNLSRSDLERKFRESLLREKVFEVITGDMEPMEEQVWARHILVGTEESAREVLQKLEEGEDWTNLAAAYSTDTSNKDQGGDLGWFGRGRMVSEFEDVAFQMDVGEISDPVQTDFGYHIIQVLGHEVRPISSSRFDEVKEQRFNEWLDEYEEQSKVEIRNNWQTEIPMIPTIPPDLIIES